MRDLDDLTPILYPLELAVIDFWKRHPDLLDLEAADAFSALARRYVVEARGEAPRAARLRGRAAELYEELLPVAEAMLHRTGELLDFDTADFETTVASVPELAEGFKRLVRSVSIWSEMGGRQGYLQYVSDLLAARP